MRRRENLQWEESDVTLKEHNANKGRQTIRGDSCLHSGLQQFHLFNSHTSLNITQGLLPWLSQSPNLTLMPLDGYISSQGHLGEFGLFLNLIKTGFSVSDTGAGQIVELF